MSYLNVDLDYFDHPKTKRLIGLLGKGAAELPIRLWAYTGKHYSDDGRLTGHSAQEIESAIGWWGAPGKCAAALVKVNFLEPFAAAEGFAVHDWAEHSGHIGAFKAKSRAAAKARWDKTRAEADRMLEAMPGALPERSVSSPLAVPAVLVGRKDGEVEASARRPTGKKAKEPAEGFAEWYAVYPNKVAKAAAVKAWDQRRPDEALRAKMGAAVEAQKRWRVELDAAGHFVPSWPNPATWLHGQRWEDELPMPPAAARAGAPRGGATAVLQAEHRPPGAPGYQPQTPVQRVLCVYKQLKGMPIDDAAWDAAQWALEVPAALRLLGAFDGDDRAASVWLDRFAADMTKKNKPEWALRWAAGEAWNTKGDRQAAPAARPSARGRTSRDETATGADVVGELMGAGEHFAPEEEHHG